MSPENESAPALPPATPPPEPEMHWILAAIARRWPAVRNFFIHLAFFVAGAIAILFLYEKFIIPGKDAELGQKDETIRTISEERDAANRDNEKLRSDNANLQEARDEKNFPLKKRAQILAQQIYDFADSLEKDKSQQAINFFSNEWNNRLNPRMEMIIRALDEEGQHSDKIEQIEQMNFGMINDPKFISAIREEAAEIKKFAVAIPETP